MLDLGCHPGAWLQVSAKHTTGSILGIDLKASHLCTTEHFPIPMPRESQSWSITGTLRTVLSVAQECSSPPGCDSNQVTILKADATLLGSEERSHLAGVREHFLRQHQRALLITKATRHDHELCRAFKLCCRTCATPQQAMLPAMQSDPWNWAAQLHAWRWARAF